MEVEPGAGFDFFQRQSPPERNAIHVLIFDATISDLLRIGVDLERILKSIGYKATTSDVRIPPPPPYDSSKIYETAYSETSYTEGSPEQQLNGLVKEDTNDQTRVLTVMQPLREYWNKNTEAYYNSKMNAMNRYSLQNIESDSHRQNCLEERPARMQSMTPLSRRSGSKLRTQRPARSQTSHNVSLKEKRKRHAHVKNAVVCSNPLTSPDRMKQLARIPEKSLVSKDYFASKRQDTSCESSPRGVKCAFPGCNKILRQPHKTRILREHVRLHWGKCVFQCQHCDAALLTSTQYRRHYLKFHPRMARRSEKSLESAEHREELKAVWKRCFREIPCD